MGTGPASASEAMEMVHAGLGWLAAADATALGGEEQARCLQMLEQAHSMGTAARASILAAFTCGQGYSADADYSPRAWLIHKARISKGAAVGHTAWARRAAAHPLVVAVLAGGEMSESFGRTICTWTDKLPPDCRQAADEILARAAAAGMGLPELAGLAREILDRSRPDLPDEDPDRGLEDRAVRLVTTFEGAGVLHGDLTPACAAVVTAVLDALSAPARRRHPHASAAVPRRAPRSYAAAGRGRLLPERAGQPVKALVHVSLADLMMLEGSSALMAGWTAHVREQWAAHRAAASMSGSDGGAWLDGDAARAFTCDASVTPVVTGEVNPAALDELVRLCVELGKLGHHDGTGEEDAARPRPARTPPARGTPSSRPSSARPSTSCPARARLAGFLRRRQLGARLGGPSLPLDVGVSTDIPAAIRRAVILRDQHCRFPGGCDQPAAACEVHHLTHKADGGKTSINDCALFCTFHHQVIIHQQGWTVVLNPDGTTTAWNKDKSKVLHSHSPPARPG